MRCQNCMFEFPDENTKVCPLCGASADDTAEDEVTIEVSDESADEAVAELIAEIEDGDDSVKIEDIDLDENESQDEPEIEIEIFEVEDDAEVDTLSGNEITLEAIEEHLAAAETVEEEKKEAAPPVVPAPTPDPFCAKLRQVWPDWQLVEKIGSGSYGIVYRALRRDSNVESHAAIKIISIPSDDSEIDSLRSEGLDYEGTKAYFKSIVDDFVSEIALLQSLKGIQNIVSVEDYKVMEKKKTIGWDIFIRMELLVPFNTYICDRIMSEGEVLALGVDICTALEFCSQRNIIHRDIKPENIFVNDFGYYKLGDFGIARKLENITGGLSQKGTYNYMAPEVANSDEYDARVDTYSLGIMLYRLLNNNRLPFIDSPQQVISPNDRRFAVDRRIRGEALPAPCGASPAMAEVVLRACAFDPANRFASPTQMKNALLAVSNGTYVVKKKAPVTAPPVQATMVFGANQAKSAPPVATVPVVPNAAAAPTVASPVPPAPAAPAAPANAPKKAKKAKKDDKDKKKGAGKIVAISIAAVVLVAVITLGLIYFLSPAYSAYQSFVADRYSDALEKYEDSVDGNGLQQFILDMHLKNYDTKIVDTYKKGDASLEATHEALSVLTVMGYDSAKEKDDKILSDYANETLDKYSMKEIEYNEAITIFRKLFEFGYKDAQRGIDAVMDSYAKHTESQFKKGTLTYDETIAILRDLKEEGYKNADAIIESLMDSASSTIVNRYNSGELTYDEAVEALTDLEDEGHDVTAALNTLASSCAQSIVDRYIKGEIEYPEAMNALRDLEDDYDMTEYAMDIMTACAESIVDGYSDGEIEYEDAVADLAILAEDGYDIEDDLNDIRKEYCKSITNSFEEGTIDFEKAKEILEGLVEEGFEKASDYLEDITTIHDSDIAFEAGSDYYSEENYEGAIEELSKVSRDSQHYEEAKELLETIYEEYMTSVIEDAAALAEEFDFAGALELITKADELIPSKQDKKPLNTAKEEVLTSHKEYVTEKVEELVKEEDFISALAVVNEAIEFIDDDDFTTLKEDVESQYVESVSEQAQEYVDKDDFISALNVATLALQYLPENEELKALISALEENAPTYFAIEYDPYSSNGYTEFVDGETMNMASEKYSNGFTMVEGSSAIFNIGGKFETITFTVGHIDASAENDAVINIYCDGEIKETITLTATDLPKKITVNISGAQLLQFVYPDADSGSSSGTTYGFANVIVEE